MFDKQKYRTEYSTNFHAMKENILASKDTKWAFERTLIQSPHQFERTT